MSWRELTQTYKVVLTSVPGSDESERAWSTFCDIVQTSAPPYHIKLLLDRVEAYRGTRNRAEIVILDHGCGGAMTLFYLAVLGYTNFYGYDIGGDFVSRNAIARGKFGHGEDRLSLYDGKTVPLPDAAIDIVFSQQVIEHLRDNVLDSYYREEGRVLKPRGLALHYVPHRLVPYDSHTKTWLIHYLPRPLYRSAARLLGSPVPDHLHLRWPWVHKKMLRRYIGNVVDCSVERFSTPPDADHYDGSLRLRRLLSTVMNAPLFGRAASYILSRLVMLETVSCKRVDA